VPTTQELLSIPRASEAVCFCVLSGARYLTLDYPSPVQFKPTGRWHQTVMLSINIVLCLSERVKLVCRVS
jgi:hypothetical protein